MIKLAILSYWHVHAKDYHRQANEHPDTSIIALWDEIPERGQAIAREKDIPFYESLSELLALPELDGVMITAPTSMHRDVMIAAAKARKHIFTEKVIAPTFRECNEIIQEVEKANVKLTVSLPRLNEGYTLAIQQMLDAQLLGQLTTVRVRLSHNGAIKNWLPEHFYNLAQCGGGALIDLGCHPMYLTRLFLGLPKSVNTSFGFITDREVEDQAVSILQYANGAIGIVEAGFVNSHCPFSIEVHGTEGSLVYGCPEPILKLRTNLKDESYQKDWLPIHLPENKLPAFHQWVSHILNDTIADENISLAIDLTKLMEASNLSVKNQRPVDLTELKI
jgi:1,5-anhydro-D-fructose reductase (1,5-anhydro-D-mannitol-forming)